MERRIRQPEVMALTGLSRSTIWRRVKEKKLHPPEKDGGTTYWRESWIKDYLDNRQTTQ